MIENLEYFVLLLPGFFVYISLVRFLDSDEERNGLETVFFSLLLLIFPVFEFLQDIGNFILWQWLGSFLRGRLKFIIKIKSAQDVFKDIRHIVIKSRLYYKFLLKIRCLFLQFMFPESKITDAGGLTDFNQLFKNRSELSVIIMINLGSRMSLDN